MNCLNERPRKNSIMPSLCSALQSVSKCSLTDVMAAFNSDVSSIESLMSTPLFLHSQCVSTGERKSSSSKIVLSPVLANDCASVYAVIDLDADNVSLVTLITLSEASSVDTSNGGTYSTLGVFIRLVGNDSII